MLIGIVYRLAWAQGCPYPTACTMNGQYHDWILTLESDFRKIMRTDLVNLMIDVWVYQSQGGIQPSSSAQHSIYIYIYINEYLRASIYRRRVRSTSKIKNF